MASIKTGLQQAGLPSREVIPPAWPVKVSPVRIRTINGYPAEYMDLGAGEPIVFIHGAASDYRGWADLELPISARQRYVAYTQRCFGSQPDPCGHTTATFQTRVDDLAAFVESLQSGPVHVVGWSAGASLSSALAATRPDLVKSAIHFEPVSDALVADDASVQPIRGPFLARYGPVRQAAEAGDSYATASRFLETVFELEPGGFENERVATKRMVTDNIAATLNLLKVGGTSTITCDFLRTTRVPSLVVLGERTNGYWSAISRRAVECIPGANLAVVSGVKHDGPIRKPQEFADLILGFVEKHTGTGQQSAR